MNFALPRACDDEPQVTVTVGVGPLCVGAWPFAMLGEINFALPRTCEDEPRVTVTVGAGAACVGALPSALLGEIEFRPTQDL